MTIPQDSASLIQILGSVLLPQPDERTRAEKLLSEYGRSPGFLLQLAGVGLDATQSVPVRQMSWVFARQLLFWGDRGEDEKGAVKKMLLGGIEVRCWRSCAWLMGTCGRVRAVCVQRGGLLELASVLTAMGIVGPCQPLPHSCAMAVVRIGEQPDHADGDRVGDRGNL